MACNVPTTGENGGGYGRARGRRGQRSRVARPAHRRLDFAPAGADRSAALLPAGASAGTANSQENRPPGGDLEKRPRQAHPVLGRGDHRGPGGLLGSALGGAPSGNRTRFHPCSVGQRRSVSRHRPGLLHPPLLHIPPVFIFIPFRSSSQERTARLCGLNGHPSRQKSIRSGALPAPPNSFLPGDPAI